MNAPNNAALSNPSLYSECVAAGLQIDSHESDLYILDSPEARRLVARYEGSHLSTFVSPLDSKSWIEVTFAYAPYWDKKEAGRTVTRADFDAWLTTHGLPTKLYDSTVGHEVPMTTQRLLKSPDSLEPSQRRYLQKIIVK